MVAVFLGTLVVQTGCDSQSALTDDVDTPAVPRLIAPIDRSDDEENALFLEWSPAETGTTFDIVVATDPGFEKVFFSEDRHPEATVILRTLQIGQTYYWRVRAVNEMGASAWSQTWSFTPSVAARVAPAPPLVSPPHNALLGLEVTVQWEPVAGARSYDLQLAQEDVFVRMDIDVEGVTTTYLRLSSLIEGYEYFWRVRSRNAAGVSGWSTIRRIQIGYSWDTENVGG